MLEIVPIIQTVNIVYLTGVSIIRITRRGVRVKQVKQVAVASLDRAVPDFRDNVISSTPGTRNRGVEKLGISRKRGN